MRRLEYQYQRSIYFDLDTEVDVPLSEINNIENCIVRYYCDDTYLVYGKVHREDGPAVISYKTKHRTEIIELEYCLEDTRLNIEDWLQKISKENRLKYLFSLGQYT